MGIRGEAARAWGRARALAGANPWAVDIGLAALVQAAMTMPFVVPRPPELEPATWPAYGLTTLTVLPLIWRRRAPFTVLLAILATSTLYVLAVEGPGQPLPYTGLVIVYTIALLSPPRTRLAAAALLIVAVPASVWLNTRSARELTFSLFVFAAAYAFGRLTDARQRTSRVEAEQAAARERARIAREMHDILSHAVSLMVVQAEAGPLAVRSAPEKAEAAFDAISQAGRDAMAQLRSMLGVLREEDGPAPRAPQPGMDALPELLARVRAGGLGVTYTTTGEPRTLPPALGATVHRIVQEALTNAYKHAPGATIGVELRYEPDAFVVEVVNGAAVLPAGDVVSGGQGLTGLHERARLVGGMVHAGPVDDGGFRVAGVLPYGVVEVTPLVDAADDFRQQSTSPAKGEGVPVMNWRADPLSDLSFTERELAMSLQGERARSRSGGVALGCGIAVAAAVLLVIAGGFGLFFLIGAVNKAMIDPKQYEEITVGMEEQQVRDRLPSGDSVATSGLHGKGPKEPEGSRCLVLMSSDVPDDITVETEPVFRFCFKDGKLVEKKAYDVRR